ncbi:MAG: hypothetical protein HYV63_23280 [Candidatus Schekmanbacteria bacterium]|nr:hypothetical protein [Candidatus Schekmanbacteria bacterium]
MTLKTAGILGLVLTGSLLLAASTARAANNDSIVVNFQVNAFSEIQFQEASVLLVATPPAPGANPAPVTQTAHYDISTNEVGRKITGNIDSGMPANTALRLNLTPPAGATGGGNLILPPTPGAVDLVTNIGPNATVGLNAVFEFAPNATAGVINPSQSRTCTITIIAQ